jgi:hypothetical protein
MYERTGRLEMEMEMEMEKKKKRAGKYQALYLYTM